LGQEEEVKAKAGPNEITQEEEIYTKKPHELRRGG
jgi:hypothetical protein